MRERRNWERVAVTVSSQPLTKTVCRVAIEKLTENILEKRAGSTRRTAAEKALKNALQECRR